MHEFGSDKMQMVSGDLEEALIQSDYIVSNTSLYSKSLVQIATAYYTQHRKHKSKQLYKR